MDRQRFDSLSARSASIASWIFVSVFLNTGVFALLAGARVPAGSSNPVGWLGLLQGGFADTEDQWFASVGVAILLTICLQTFTPHLEPAIEILYFRWRKYRLAPLQNCQRDLDKL